MSLGRPRRAGLVAGALLLIGPGPGAAGAEEPRTIDVVAKRFAFDPAVIEVDQGESLRLMLRSADVTHGFEIEGYDVKVEIPKGGEPVSVELVADRAGTFGVKCSEYCGSGHRRMRGELVVRAADGGAR